MSGFSAQSAMEYLMTYGWAILIVAVVLAALFQLGVFSGVTSPRAQPGTCRVLRPMGPGTSAYASLQGVCTGMLPQYVAEFSGYKHISVANDTILRANPFTMSFWMKTSQQWTTGMVMEAGTDVCNNWAFLIYTYEAGYGGDTANSIRFSDRCIYNGKSPSFKIQPGVWYHVVEAVNSTASKMYVNGVLYVTDPGYASFKYVGNIRFGSGAYAFYGSLSNIQMYNASLSANEVLALYREGIGGAPIQVRNLIGWWPLNGNANDTSGNLHNGVPTGVAYTSTWTDGYSLR